MKNRLFTGAATMPTPSPTPGDTRPPSGEIIIPHIRWMIRRDLREVLEIEFKSFPHPWDNDEFIERLRSRNCIGMVAENGEQILGYMVYELHRSRIELLNIAVDVPFRRQRVGEAMLGRLTSKLSSQRRHSVMASVWDRNLPAHLWLRACGWRATSVVGDHYRFEYRIGG